MDPNRLDNMAAALVLALGKIAIDETRTDDVFSTEAIGLIREALKMAYDAGVVTERAMQELSDIGQEIEGQ